MGVIPLGMRQEWGLLVLALLIAMAVFFDKSAFLADSFHDWPCPNPQILTSGAQKTLVCSDESSKEVTLQKVSDSRVLLLGSKMDINKASELDLQVLPRIGPVLAKRIVEYRREIVSFRNLDELEDVKGIGPKTLLKIKPYLKVRPSEPDEAKP